MSPTRIHTIKKIDNYRIFQGWKPSGGVEFARVNLIYGQNGSGKSTLASLLQGCATYAADESTERGTRHAEIISAGLNITVCDSSGTSTSDNSSISLDDQTFWARVRVFNKDFVRHNLAFGTDGGPQPQALLTIGKINVDVEAELAELNTKLDEVRSKIDPTERAVETAEKSKNGRLTDIARDVGHSLARTSLAEYQARSYKRPRVEKLLADSEKDSTILDDASLDVAADIKTASGTPMKRVVLPKKRVLLEGAGLVEVRSLLDSSILDNNVIRELKGHPDRARWVQEGLHLHDSLNDCLFCGQEFTSERRAALNAHFDESYKRLQDQIDVLIGRLERSVEDSGRYLSSIPADGEVYEDLRWELERARQIYRLEHDAYRQRIEVVVAALKEKKNNPFSIPVLDRELDLAAPDVAAFEKVVAAHSEKIDSHDKDARAAARRVELYYVKNFVDEYKRLKQEVEDKRAAYKELQDQMNRLGGRIAELTNVDGDPVPGAKKLTEGLRGLLGRDELKFSVQDSKHYAIERGGVPATHLSEGEQTAIALLYFLHSVREDKIQGEPPIVIIDDPVSSLDHGILFGASAHIWAELVVNTYASQVFLLTHNFELFRQWLIQIEGIPRKEWKNYSAHRVLARSGGGGQRRPEFEVWEIGDERRKKLRSQYHFRFDQVATTLKRSIAGLDSTAQMEAAALTPNSVRQLLEGFLSFRSPATMGRFHHSVRAVLEGHPGLDDSVRTMVVRYAHAHSHMEEADPMTPLEISETVPFLRALFTFMNHVDGDHFRSMCEALGHDPDALLAVSAPSEPGASS